MRGGILFWFIKKFLVSIHTFFPSLVSYRTPQLRGISFQFTKELICFQSSGKKQPGYSLARLRYFRIWSFEFIFCRYGNYRKVQQKNRFKKIVLQIKFYQNIEQIFIQYYLSIRQMQEGRKPKDFIDLRSDVISVPPQEMLLAMSTAEVGDDVFEDDPTANKFQATVAEYFGFQASMIVPSTTMANLLSVLLLTKPGDEIIIWGNAHTVQRQSAGIAVIGGVQTRQILQDTGIFTLESVKKRVRKQSQHITFPDTSLIMIENPTYTGEVWPLETLASLKAYAQKQKVQILMDGARITNAIARYGCSPKQVSKYCDVMTMCLSKGLCCPFGSLVFGTADMIKKARHIRKSLGGGMRQIGIIGAAGLYALEHMVPEVKLDNDMATYIGEQLQKIPGIVVDRSTIHSNMVNYKVNIEDFNHSGYFQFLFQNLIRMKPLNQDRQQYRVVTHRTIRKEQCDKFISLTRQFFSQYDKQPKLQSEVKPEQTNTKCEQSQA